MCSDPIQSKASQSEDKNQMRSAAMGCCAIQSDPIRSDLIWSEMIWCQPIASDRIGIPLKALQFDDDIHSTDSDCHPSSQMLLTAVFLVSFHTWISKFEFVFWDFFPFFFRFSLERLANVQIEGCCDSWNMQKYFPWWTINSKPSPNKRRDCEIRPIIKLESIVHFRYYASLTQRRQSQPNNWFVPFYSFH